MTRCHPLVILSLVLFAVHPSAWAESRTVRILIIGNSFSRNATHHLGDLARAGGHNLIHQPIVVGGASLELHASMAQKHEADPKDKAGFYTNGRSLRDELRAEKWDYVTIQQASLKSHDPATYQPFARWLADYIATYAPSAKRLLHQTWAYRVDDPRFTKPSGKPGEPKTQEEMYLGLTRAYRGGVTAAGCNIHNQSQ